MSMTDEKWAELWQNDPDLAAQLSRRQEREQREAKRQFTEAPASVTVKCQRGGYDIMVTMRDEDGAALLPRVIKALDWMAQNGFEPTTRKAAPQPSANGNGHVASGDAPLCQYHGPMKESKYGGYYCPAKMGDGSYCQEKVA